MKKIFTLFVSSLFSFSLLAFEGNGLSISKINTTMNFKVEVDGKKVSIKKNSITLSDLEEGYHNVRIYRVVKENDLSRKEQIIYGTSVFLSKAYHTDIQISSSGKVVVNTYPVSSENDWYAGKDDDRIKFSSYSNSEGWYPDYTDVISNVKFQTIKDRISKEWYETSRVELAKSIIDKNNFTTAQVKELMYLFSFENNRLEIAKYAYIKTADKQNYFQLNDALACSSCKDDLARFIRESRQ